MNKQVNPVGMVKDIYKITNNINGKIYIGQSKNTLERWKTHCKFSRNNSVIDKAINYYGKEIFSIEIVERQITNYNEREAYWIKYYDCKVPKGYNLTDGGENPPVFYGTKHPNASIKNEQVLSQLILDLIDTNKSYDELANIYHTNKKTVMGINNGTRYFNAALEYPLRKQSNINGILTESQIDEIIEELKYSYETNTDIGKHYGVSEHTIRDINAGRAHKQENLIYPIRNINAARSKVNYAQLMEIANLLQNTNISINAIAKQYHLDWNTIQNINLGSSLYFRPELSYPLRLPPHKTLTTL